MAVFYGTTNPDTVNGATGTDTLYGWARGGKSTSPSGKDTLNGKAGNDKLYGGTDNDSLYGDQGNDTLYGNSGKDYLSGGRGDDQLRGNSGNDSLRGWENSDSLYGDEGNDTLDGGKNSDNLYGGTGNDTYFIDDYYDIFVSDEQSGAIFIIVPDGISEDLNGGIDTMMSSLNISSISDEADKTYSRFSISNDLYTLPSNVENLILRGNSDSGSGNDLNNIITGNAGNNDLDGGGGNDTLIGGAGADEFRFSGFGFQEEEGIDNIADFVVADDTISVSTFFGGGLTEGAAITTAQFRLGSAARDASDRFIYNQNTGALYFDEDGTGTINQVQFASLSTGLAMTNADITAF